MYWHIRSATQGHFTVGNLMDSPAHQHVLPVFRLTGCNLTDQHCEIVASALQSSNSLRELDLSNNHLQDSGVKLLCAGLKSTNCQLNILRFGFYTDSDCNKKNNVWLYILCMCSNMSVDVLAILNQAMTELNIIVGCKPLHSCSIQTPYHQKHETKMYVWEHLMH